MLIFDNPFGISINISLNSFMKGGKTKIKNIKTMKVIIVITKNKETSRGSLIPFCIWLVKLQTIFEITREHIIKSRKSFSVHTINRNTKITVSLKYNELFN